MQPEHDLLYSCKYQTCTLVSYSFPTPVVKELRAVLKGRVLPKDPLWKKKYYAWKNIFYLDGWYMGITSEPLPILVKNLIRLGMELGPEPKDSLDKALRCSGQRMAPALADDSHSYSELRKERFDYDRARGVTAASCRACALCNDDRSTTTPSSMPMMAV
eukprot:scaffold1259_cov239-Pinguiococcus_pyrenoidosus.AAC.2